MTEVTEGAYLRQEYATSRVASSQRAIDSANLRRCKEEAGCVGKRRRRRLSIRT